MSIRSMLSREWFSTQRLTALFMLLVLVVSACSSGGGADSQGTPAVDPNALRISFLYTSEKRAWVEAATKAFNESKAKIAGGRVVYVDLEVTGSVESTQRILDGTSKPALWSPASRLVLPIMNDEWAQKQGKEFVADSACKNGVLSPVVIMMWKPMAEALGWPSTDIGWADIAKIATNPQGWAAYGKPQWGTFRFGHTHPDYSNSGLQTIIAMSYAATGKQRGLTVEDVEKKETAKFIADLESSIAHYGSSTGFFGDAMIARGTSYLSAAVVYENVVASSYDKQTEFPLVAIYPKEGTFLSDHPLCLPDAPWLTAELKEAATTYRDYLLSEPVQQQALQLGFRPADSKIAIGAPLDTAHGVDPKQAQNELSVPDAKTIRAVRDLWKKQKRLVNLTMVIDISGSMKDDNKMAGAREGAAAFIEQLDASDNLTIIVFDDRQDILFENVNVGQNREKLMQEVRSLTHRGGTALYDSIAFSVERMKVDPKRINAVVVMTDGQDTNSSRFKDPQLLMNALRTNAESVDRQSVAIFTIGYGKDADENILKQIADRGGGAYRSGGTTNIREVYREMSTFF
jgi:Ca-activated chloride channel family protein